MAESQSLNRCLNPWALHVQKLGLELKCPLCLNLLNRPILPPCDHIFCKYCLSKSTQFESECPLCKHQYANRDIRLAPCLENLINIYQSLDTTLSANLINSVSSDGGRVSEKCPDSLKMIGDVKLWNDLVEEPHDGNSSNGQSISQVISHKRVHAYLNDGEVGLIKEEDKFSTIRSDQPEEIDIQTGKALGYLDMQIEKQDVNQVTQLLSGSPISSGPDCSNDSVLKGLVNSNSERTPPGINEMNATDGNYHIRDSKKQKKLNYELFEKVVKNDSLVSASRSECAMTFECLYQPNAGGPCSGINSTLVSALHKTEKRCGFCHSFRATDGTGPMLHYLNGIEVGEVTNLSKVIHVHRKCIEWTPQVYFVEDTIKNLESELSRAAKLRCTSCGLKGAALGCFVRSCRRTYHVPCAYEIQGCRWDTEDFLMLCPSHHSVKFPREKSRSNKHAIENEHSITSQITEKRSTICKASPDVVKEFVLCGSALSSEEKYLLVKFASKSGVPVTKVWRPNVTHVIAATDEKGACIRTLKVLMAILNGRWIVTMDWIKASMEAMCPVDEEPHEVNLDNHGCCDGPKTGRLRALDNAPKLFNDFKFYFSGGYVPAYKTDLIKLVRTAGGAVIESREQLMIQSLQDREIPSTSVVVYNFDPPQGCELVEGHSVLQRAAVAEKLADETGCQAVRHTWILESIAACKLQPLPWPCRLFV